MENEDGDVGLVTETIDGRAAAFLSLSYHLCSRYTPSGVSTGSPHYCQCLFGCIGRLSGVSPNEEEFE